MMRYTEKDVVQTLAWAESLPDDPSVAPKSKILAAALRDVRERQRWIPVTERLPTEYSWVLVCADGAINCLFWNSKINGFEEAFIGNKTNIVIDDITHWMPLPPPPEEV